MTTTTLQRAMVCLLGAACLTAGADSTDVATWTGTGLFTAETVEAFGTGTNAFPLGNGMIKYTGPSATLDRPIAIAVDGGRAATVRVTDPEATLTISKPVTQTSGAFIKDGPGTLRLAGANMNVLGKKRATNSEDARDLSWDEATGQTSSTNGYGVFTINDGRVVFGDDGQTNQLMEIDWIGTRTQKSVQLDVVGGTFRQDNGWFCISRGTGQTTNDVTATMNISGGANVTLSSLCMNNQNGMGNYFGRSRLNVENASLTIPGDVYIGEGTGDPQIYVGPGATFLCSQKVGRDNNRGFQIGRYGSATSTVTVCGGTLGFRTGYVRKNSSLIVTNGGTLKMDTTHKGFVNGNSAAGDVFVDNATIAPYTTANKGMIADWFNQHSGAFTVGAGGVTFDTPVFGHLGAVPTSGAAGASITKTGAGVFSLAPNALPVTARAGTLRMGVSPQGWTNDLTGAIALDAGAKLEVSGDAALGAMTVNADAAQFDAFGLERARSWSCFGNARWTADGFVYVTDGTDVDNGSAIALTARPVRVDRSFTLAFDTYLSYPTWAAGEKWTVFLKKDAAVTTSTKDRSGYTGVPNSFGVNVDIYYNFVSFGEGGDFVETNLTAGGNYVYSGTDYAKKCRCRLAYDAAAKRATFTMLDVNGHEAAWTHDVDLVTCIGTNMAYLSFGGGTGGAASTMAFSNVRIASEAPAVTEIARVGGAKTLGADETFTVTVKPNECLDGFLMGRLDYADGATLAVEEVADARLPAAPLTLDDHSLWTLSNGAYWREDGSLATSRMLDGSRLSGSATSVNRYAVDGDWRLAFTFDLGAHDGTPADYVRMNLCDPSGDGLRLEFRYYEIIRDVDEAAGTTNTTHHTKTQLKLYRRNWVQDKAQSVLDLSPIDFVRQGPAKVAFAYDAAAQTLTVDLSQKDGALTKQIVLTDVDMTSLLANNTRATVQFTGAVGGMYSENVISDLSLTCDNAEARRAAAPGFFGFERLAGAGTLVKTGAADLGLVDDGANADANLRLAGGGLRLRREREEDVTMGDAPNGWTFSHASGRYLANGLQIGKYEWNHKSTAQLRHRVRVDGDWDCTFSLWINGGDPADAVSFFFHNDPRGPQCVGSDAGFSGIQNGFPIGWYFYPGNKSAYCKMNAGSLSYTESFEPLVLSGNTTDIAISYRAAEKTLTCVMAQGETVVTNTFTGRDVVSAVKDTSAWMGFGVGSGGCQATPRITNFRFTRCATEAATDQDAARYLASVAVAEDATVRLETTKSNAVFRVADAVTVAEGRTLTAASLNAPATLAMGTLTLGAESALAGDGATTVKPDALAGELDALTLKGVTLAVSETTRAARSLAESTVTLTGGAQLAVPAGQMLSVRAVYVDGVKQGAGVYAADAADWVASGSVTIGGGTVFLLR